MADLEETFWLGPEGVGVGGTAPSIRWNPEGDLLGPGLNWSRTRSGRVGWETLLLQLSQKAKIKQGMFPATDNFFPP